MKIYAVGGAIRDTLMDLPVHDIDYVVVGSSVEEMIAKGYRPVGKDFPVFLHPETQAEYALARTERKTGQGYKGFHFYADPSVTLEQDLERRDLTINAMAQEVGADGKQFGPIIDPYNGQEDLAAKIFRHVSNAFAEDPLRLLRIARFSARFPEFSVADETLSALKAIVQSGELKALSAERIWQELARGLVATKPMHLFQVLLNTGAAGVILPPSLTTKLADEPFREQLITHFSCAGNSLDERCAIILMDLSAKEIRSWADCVRMPIEVRDFSEIFSDLRVLVNTYLNHSYQAKDILAWFNRADLWRKPDRVQAILNLADKLGMNTLPLMNAMRNAQTINAAEIIASVAVEDRSNGERIGSTFESARLAAITAALNS
ncbi:polynucleotide adenylyltransferase [Polynucleobacter sp. AP-Capit-er-40B-B4]|uniref:polynucleotide adenylyltransferase n=1 Tax=Polynucleobacter sp. AP-Capit-er-40B-B4 TaxID=2576927 RepID=UPI001C0DF243|nr:polynucleotide adenylyltransferase [Polynucleobacter sp. AP-Capit-er-40B-B4]MBU3581941.1 polynucleotide adenylyltransferase [Polynucleobacter sp. AP-Capit-er-40B-B4]